MKPDDTHDRDELEAIRKAAAAGRVPGGYSFRIYPSDQPEEEREEWTKVPGPSDP